ncbi:hypothetical protein RhiLY_10737 [Ceratobasidium sp. AG-Ba]|nr:hypothetical protein RhiLY_10737 [Ceratobasidium sp. AG-Ba]
MAPSELEEFLQAGGAIKGPSAEEADRKATGDDKGGGDDACRGHSKGEGDGGGDDEAGGGDDEAGGGEELATMSGTGVWNSSGECWGAVGGRKHGSTWNPKCCARLSSFEAEVEACMAASSAGALGAAVALPT